MSCACRRNVLPTLPGWLTYARARNTGVAPGYARVPGYARAPGMVRCGQGAASGALR